MKKLLVYLGFFLVAFPLFLNNVFAKIGVGVNTGKIEVEEKLKAGMFYKLPPITIINTGDEAAEYEAAVSYHQEQPELRPEQDWFIFSPQKFNLEPGKGQLVEIKINLPLRVEPGDYFAYLEGHPIVTTQKGTANIGVAAAAKLYFKVVPANIFYGIFYKISTFFKVYAPWPQRVLFLAVVLLILLFFKKFFNIKISFKKPISKNSISDKKDG